jgi:hypothetical protein
MISLLFSFSGKPRRLPEKPSFFLSVSIVLPDGFFVLMYLLGNSDKIFHLKQQTLENEIGE